jgi:hypothetical protein
MWGLPRRLIYALAVPLGAPALRLLRLAASLRERPSLRIPFIVSLPAIAVMYLSDAIGESLGYLLGAGGAERDIVRFELEAERAGT